MKLTKAEKIWIIVVAAFYILYNLPGVPPYYQPVASLVHGALTIIPLWIAVYVGLAKVYKIYEIRDDSDENAPDAVEGK